MRLICALVLTVAMAAAVLLTQGASGGLAQPAETSPTPPLPRKVIAVFQPKQEDDDDGPDVLLMALLTTGAAAGAGALGLVGYVIRNRVGFWLHRPPPREGGETEEHH